jgi:hypothetical protein
LTIRPVYCRAVIHIDGASDRSPGGCPISMMVVCMNPRATTSPRTPPIAIRSPTLKFLPRRMIR